MARTKSALVVLLSCGLGGCTGAIESGVTGAEAPPIAPTATSSAPPTASSCADPGIGPAPLRRLTNVEYNNTVRDLLGDNSRPADAFPPDPIDTGFDNNAAQQNASDLLVERHARAAEEIAKRAVMTLDQLLGCSPAAMGEDACARRFISAFGKRAFRRPLQPEEDQRLVAFYGASKAQHGFPEAIRLTVQVVLQAPAFLHRIERERTSTNGVTKLDPYEMASRLSYFLLGSMPDEPLFAAADAGKLETASQVEQQARRLLSLPAARETVRRFFRHWLEINDLEGMSKDPKAYPAFAGLQGALLQETATFVTNTVFGETPDLATLLTAPITYVNKRLAAYYGLTGARDDTFVRVTLDPARHAGVLTQGAFLAAHAKPDISSPVRRAAVIRQRFLCQELPPPPPTIDMNLPPPKAGGTTRERFAQHRADAACAACHRLLDDIGFIFEHFDGGGRWRSDEQGVPIDARGAVVEAGDLDGTYTGVRALAERMAASKTVQSCVVSQWFQFAHGRRASAGERCALERLGTAFTGDVRELLVQLVTSESFRSRTGL